MMDRSVTAYLYRKQTLSSVSRGYQMARMHSRNKGKSGSTKPSESKIPTWVRYKEKEIEKLIVKLAKEGKSASEIGVLLRDSYGIPSVKAICKKNVSNILKEKDILPNIPEDLMALIKKNIAVRKHLETNKQDKTALRGLQLTDSKIKRLVKYYKKNGRLPKDWKFEPDRIKLYVE